MATQHLREEQRRIVGLCPFQCGCKEGNMHYMICHSPRAVNARTRLINEFRKTMQQQNVHPTIVSIFITGLLWTDTTTIPTVLSIFDTNLNQTLRHAIQEQTSIGWNNIRRGFLSQQWAIVQQHYYSQSRFIGTKDWNKYFVTKLLAVSWSMWETRNTELHETSVKERRDNQLTRLRQQVDNLYQRASLFDHKVYMDLGEAFKMKKERRLKYGVVALHTWTNMAADIVVKVEKREAGSIERWLMRKEAYIGSQ